MLVVRLIGRMRGSGHGNRRGAAAVDQDHGAHDRDPGSVNFDKAPRAVDRNILIYIDGDFAGVQGNSICGLQTIVAFYLLRATPLDVNRRISLDEQA